jgi:hypothetical protein
MTGGVWKANYKESKFLEKYFYSHDCGAILESQIDIMMINQD